MEPEHTKTAYLNSKPMTDQEHKNEMEYRCMVQGCMYAFLPSAPIQDKCVWCGKNKEMLLTEWGESINDRMKISIELHNKLKETL